MLFNKIIIITIFLLYRFVRIILRSIGLLLAQVFSMSRT
jgi:hypothetical protein